jgi:hypothetical protein
MSVEDTRMDRVRRAARTARIIERLERLDDRALEVLDRLTAEAIGGTDLAKVQAVSRRQFIGVAAGGVVVAVTGGLALWQLGSARTTGLRQEAAALRRAVFLYDEMDAAGLDEQADRVLSTVGPWAAEMRNLAEGLLSTIEGARSALLDFQSRFPALQAGLQWLQERLSTVSQPLLGLENEVNQVLGLSAPIAESLGGFLAEVLDWLPSDTAPRLRGGLERMGEVVAAVSVLVQGLYARVLEPMEDWFSQRPDAGLNGWIINPILTRVLDPAQLLAEGVLGLAALWDGQLAGPVRERLQQRHVRREEIADLRAAYGF